MFIEFDSADDPSAVSINANHIVSVAQLSQTVCNVVCSDGKVRQVKGEYKTVMEKIKVATYKPNIQPNLAFR